ncbi:MAG: type II toxin-antitoxin system RelE/ParE family toxin [Phycisphaerae bacterium]|nr:type II toxin-antitoxin system RelE/ParE family toxin [Phycisphaerae bacterium]MCK6553583.1 type II toxin-antitoxin system RelE/ParE family toxin [Candidatus Binatia bacterium]
MRYEFHPEALAEYEAAALYYAERDPAVAQRFVAAVEDAIDRILDAPTRCRVLDEDVRRCLTRVFPYGVLYTIEPEFVLIVAVMHCSREPGYWKRRVAKP